MSTLTRLFDNRGVIKHDNDYNITLARVVYKMCDSKTGESKKQKILYEVIGDNDSNIVEHDSLTKALTDYNARVKDAKTPAPVAEVEDRTVMPQNAIEVNPKSRNDMLALISKLTHCDIEMRRVPYADGALDDVYTVQVFWLNKRLRVGYAIADDWRANAIVYYKLGTSKAWDEYEGR